MPVDNHKPQRFHDIRHALLREVETHPADLVTFVATLYGVTRQAVHRQVQRLVKDGLLIVEGDRRQARYRKAQRHYSQMFDITPELAEDKIWLQFASPIVQELRPNVQSICVHGFTEMVNNVLEHSAARRLTVSIDLTQTEIELSVMDNGVGIFNKIQKACKLDTPEQALFELSKGKLTTDPRNHTGEGIFFTSRIFDRFSILSGGLWYGHTREQTDWLMNNFKEKENGTGVFMKLSLGSTHTTQEVFDEFSTKHDGMDFDRTVVALELVNSGPLVSRSQAKRVLAHLDKFKEVVLDFQDVPEIGQAFGDEIFRVYRNSNPTVSISYINAIEPVTKMIRRAQAAEARSAVRNSSLGEIMRQLLQRVDYVSAPPDSRWTMLREAIARTEPDQLTSFDSVPASSRHGILELFADFAED